MARVSLDFDGKGAVDRLLRLLAVDGITGQEEAIGQAVVAELIAGGVPRKSIRFDKAHTKIPLPTQTGNLIVTLPGTRVAPRRLFMAHLDTVPLGAGAVPRRKGTRIIPAGKTALGGDDRTGVGCLLTMILTLLEAKLPHPPLTILFTVREESGLWGARFIDASDLGHPALGFNVDGRSPREITIGAVGAERWDAEIFGRAAHAGVHPEEGVSAALVAGLALAQVHQDGWFGKVKRNGREGTSNVGSIGDRDGRSAGQATNVVTDYVLVRGEARSHDPKFVRQITAAYRDAFERAARQVKNIRDESARLKFHKRLDYHPFRLKENSPVVRLTQAACAQAGWTPMLRITNGGLDANWMTRHGIPTITFGAGQNEIHTVEEYVEIADYLDACRLALALATHEAS
jgi:tripeptide aminopeptidase